jgi:hypothetical protein
VRVAGPFTVESLSPHRVMHGDEEELIDTLDAAEGKRPRAASAPPTDFAAMVLELCAVTASTRARSATRSASPRCNPRRQGDLHGRRRRAAGRHFHRSRIRHNDPRRPRRGRPRGDGRPLQAEIDRDAWETVYRDESRPFARPETGKIAVKVINHFGDEVMKVFRV